MSDKKRLYDFYTTENGRHFAREEMTKEEAQEYAKEYSLVLRDVKVCSICGEEYFGYGNNAEPVNKGRCCNGCNNTVVIPERLRSVQKRSIKNNKTKN